MLLIYGHILGCFLLLSVEGDNMSCEEHGLVCEETFKDYCCINNYFHCCNYEEYRKEDESRDVEDSFVETGLKSVLVLLIMSSAIFLVCFCLLRCFRRARGRQNPMRQVEIQDHRRCHDPSVSRPERNSILIAMLNDLPPPPSNPPVADEPPSYNEVVGQTEAEVELPDDPPPVEDASPIHDKPPPEYASIFKQNDIP